VGSTIISAAVGGVSGTYVLNVVPVGGTVQGKPLELIGSVTEFAGSNAFLNLPVGITSDGKNLYIADSINNKIKKVEIASGIVTTVAGSGDLGTVDTASGFPVRFNHPNGISTDGTCLYVTEPESNSIRKVVIATGEVKTLAAFSKPFGITTDGVNLYVTDAVNHTISSIVISTGAVTILAGSTGVSGSANGTGALATFNQPVGITTDGVNLYVNDLGNGMVRRIVIASGEVAMIAGGFTSIESGITTDGTNLYVADYFGKTIYRIVISSGSVTQLAAGFNHPQGLTSDGTYLFVANSGNNEILKLQ
jgi:sugar lactone lactonase YvrE